MVFSGLTATDFKTDPFYSRVFYQKLKKKQWNNSRKTRPENKNGRMIQYFPVGFSGGRGEISSELLVGVGGGGKLGPEILESQ